MSTNPADAAPGGSTVPVQLLARCFELHPVETAALAAQVLGPATDRAEVLLGLQQICCTTTEVLPGVVVADLAWCPAGASRPEPLVRSDEPVGSTGADQVWVAGGPAHVAVLTGHPVGMTVDQVAASWPDAAAALARTGAGSVHSTPLHDRRGEVLGAVTLHAATGAADPTGHDLHPALVALLRHELAGFLALSRQTVLAAQLTEALTSRATIEQAKGILMAAHQVGPADAFELLRRQSQSTNTKLRELARTFITEVTGTEVP